MTTTNLVVVTNIPTPYRQHEFNVLYAELQKRKIGFMVIFMAGTERTRHWTFDGKQCTFPYQIAPGLQFYIRQKQFLFNPSVLASLFRYPPTWLWLGGSWYLPTNVALTLLMQMRRRSWLLGWNESTQADQHTLKTATSLILRRLLLRPYHGWVVPGIRSAQFTQNGFLDRSVSVIRFPNTVDPVLYRDRVDSLRIQRAQLRIKYTLDKNERVLLWPARLIPEKGILPFLENILSLLREARCTILIAGEGVLRPVIEAWLYTHQLKNVRLLGHQSLDQLLELYAVADALLLPSTSEPYGFVAVEALWAKLPLFISTRVGAAPEVLNVDENGWLIDPNQPDEVRQAFAELLDIGEEALVTKGECSFQLANEHFSSEQCATQFVDELLTQFPVNSQ